MTAKEAMSEYHAHKYEPIHPYPAYNGGFGEPCRCNDCERNRNEYSKKSFVLLKQYRDSAKGKLLRDMLDRQVSEIENTPAVLKLDDAAVYDPSKDAYSPILQVLLTIADENKQIGIDL